MPASSQSPTTFTTPSEHEIGISRVFDAPRELVFAAWTRPEHVRRWYGPRAYRLVVCEIDLRPGGSYHYVMRGDDGSEFGFSGVYREIVPPERLVYTETFDGMPDQVAITTLMLTESNGKTTLTTTTDYQSTVARDMVIQSGMQGGASESLDRLADLLATLA